MHPITRVDMDHMLDHTVTQGRVGVESFDHQYLTQHSKRPM